MYQGTTHPLHRRNMAPWAWQYTPSPYHHVGTGSGRLGRAGTACNYPEVAATGTTCYHSLQQPRRAPTACDLPVAATPRTTSQIQAFILEWLPPPRRAPAQRPVVTLNTLPRHAQNDLAVTVAGIYPVVATILKGCWHARDRWSECRRCHSHEVPPGTCCSPKLGVRPRPGQPRSHDR